MHFITTRGRLLAAVLAGALAPAMLAGPVKAAEQDDQIYTFFQLDQNEYRLSDGDDAYAWEAQGWAGTDYDKLAFKTTGEQVIDGGLETAELQVLYSRLVTDFFDAQIGVRYDFEPDPERAFAVIGLQGLAPQFFEVDTALFISEDGDVSARFEAEYELLITQRLILQPSAELNVAVQEVEKYGTGSGPTDIELGLRLRYEITREFAPYIGVNYERDLFDTADFTRDEGGDVDAVSFVAGVRIFF
ncbi:MAG: copper resistance protein B [Kiloniellaceae bacterium]